MLLRQGEIKVVLTSGLTPDHPAAGYVARHGDGVANIALTTADAAGAYDRAISRGCRPVAEPTAFTNDRGHVVVAQVGGFGDVIHSLIERHGDPEEFMPGRFDVTSLAPEAVAALRTVDHVAVCLPSGELGPVTRRYQDAFGFDQPFAETIEVGAQAMDSKVVQNPASGATFTMLEPLQGHAPGQVDDFLRSHGGAGVQHLAFLCDDIVAAICELREQGVEFLTTPSEYYDALPQRMSLDEIELNRLREVHALADQDQWGKLYQIFTRSKHIRNTFFLELIQRRNARTFGSSNIRALYEAVGREQAMVAGRG